MPAPAEAVAQEIVWKNEELKAFCVSLVTKAIGGPAEFTTDLVPDDLRGDGNGMAGSAATILQQASVLDPVGHYQGDVWYPKKVLSTRKSAKGRYIAVYRLTSYPLAAAFLRRHGHGAAGAEQRCNEATLQRANEAAQPLLPALCST